MKKTFFRRAGLILAAIGIVMAGMRCLTAIRGGYFFMSGGGYMPPAGAVTGLIVVLVAIPFWFIFAYKYWNTPKPPRQR